MKKIRNIGISMWAVSLMLFFATSCVDEEIASGSPDVVEGQPVTVSMKFASAMPKSVVITRADNSLSELSNLVIFIYSSNGDFQKIVSTNATDPDDLITLGASTSNPETANSMIYPVTFNATSGTKKLLAVANTSSVADGGGFWESLSDIVQSAQSGDLDFDELKKTVISLRDDYKGENVQAIQITSDSQMLLSGWNEGVVFNTDGNVSNSGYGVDGDQSNQVVIKLDRSMARITFNIAESTPGVNGAKGTFIPSSYRVYNVPVNSYLTNKEHTAVPTGESSFEFANTSPVTIGNVNNGQYSFSFYMPENIYADVKGVNSYADRDKWNGTGENSGALPEDKTWENAPQTSTFVVIGGTYTETTANEGDHNYTGSVEYTVHLGDFSSSGSNGNFSVERNCSYTYNMSVLGVDNIVVEAQTEKDNDDSFQQGAEGDIYSYDDVTYSYQLDAHYEQVYLQYNLSSIARAVHSSLNDQSNPSDKDIDDAIAEQLILVIQSEAMDYIHEENTAEPYTVRNKRGTMMPYKIYADAVRNSQNPDDAKDAVLKGAGEGTVPTKGFDYKWVEFWPQSGTSIATYPGVSNWSKEDLSSGFANSDPYGGRAHGNNLYLLDVYDVIVKMGKVVKKIYKNEYLGERETISETSRGEDGITVTNTDYYNDNYVARFTAFVNEYYYYKHPLTGAKITSWSLFTNKIPREMIITMNSDVSNDGNSTYNELYSYISQLSMQTFYNSREMQLDAFGIETYNETPLCFWGGGDNANASTTEGRRNQLNLIGTGWSTYINFANNGWTSSVTTERSSHKLDNDAYAYNSRNQQYAYYACLSRNRDLNGDGQISDDEVRWYLPSLNEYIRMSIGTNVLSNASQLYFGDKAQMNEDDYPVEYIDEGSLYYTSGTSGERVFWAVERGSYGPINSWSDGTNYESKKKPIRCIRLLPGNKDSNHDISSDDIYVADATYEMKQATGNTPIVLNFKGRLVDDLYRERTDGALNRHNEDDETNSFYDGIFVASSFLEDTYTLREIIGYSYREIWGSNYWYEYRKENPCEKYSQNGYSNWRVPNLAEFSAMNAAGLLSGGPSGAEPACCTSFSNKDVRYGFGLGGYIYCPGPNEGLDHKVKIRCVRDVPANFNLDN